MKVYKKAVICILLGMVSGVSAAIESPDESLLQRYCFTFDHLLEPLGPEVAEPKPEPNLFPIGQEKQILEFRLNEKPRPEVTGNPSIDNLNVRQLNKCLRAFGSNLVAFRYQSIGNQAQ